jgi:GTP-binding protein EngB required for normal cell division
MSRRILAVIVTAVILALAGAGLWFGRQMRFIPPPVFNYLWPTLVAVAFLAFALIALFARARPWLWPLGTGFVVQGLGILLYALKAYESPWQILAYTLGAVGIVLVLVLLVWLVLALRSRWLEKRMVEGLGGEGDVGREELQKIRDNMMEALSLLRRAGGGSHALYELPWFLVMGRSQAGKTVAIKNSGLGLPVRKDWVKGVGGTHTANWFFTKELIFLDTPGKWVTEGADEQTRRNWVELLKLLRKYRGRRPLDGLVVVVPADDLLSRSDDELEDQASHVREVVDLLHQELQFRFPVYLLVSKCDLVEGFTEFFRGLPAQRRYEILGWSHADPSARVDTRRLTAAAMQSVLKRLDAYRLEMVARIASTRRARRLFFFPEEFRRLERPLQAFAETFFLGDPSGDTPLFRGVYFTSGTQGEGSTVARAMSEFARALGITPARAAAAEEEEEPKRSYFLLELFRDLLSRDQGLVSGTTLRWWRRQRNTALGVFLPAGAACLFLLFCVIAFLLNLGLYRAVERDVPGIVSGFERSLTAGNGAEASERRILPALNATGTLRDLHRKMVGFSLVRGFGMRRPGGLEDQVFGYFEAGFNDAVLEPTLRSAQAFASAPDRSCLERIDVLHSVIWLRMGRRAQWSDDLQGFDRLWQLPKSEALRAREDLLRQFGYLKDHAPRGKTLLPGFSIRDVAQTIRKDCSRQGATSSLAMYDQLQESCRSAATPREIQDCYARLREILRYQEQDYVKFQSHFQDLKSDLASLQGIEPEAPSGLGLLQEVDLAKIETGECLTRFNSSIVPEIRAYADQDKLIEECRGAVELVKGKDEKFKERDRIVKEQGEKLKGDEQDVTDSLARFSNECKGAVSGFKRLEFPTLKSILDGYRQVACVKQWDVLVQQWEDLRAFYDKKIAGRFPFAGGAAGDAVDPDTLKAFLGGQTGLVPQVIETARGETLSPEAQAWLDRSAALSHALFEPGKDDVRKVPVVLTLGAEGYEPGDLAKKVKLDALRLNLGSSSDFNWSEGQPRTQHFDIDATGENANLGAALSLRKGFLGRMVGSDYQAGRPMVGPSSAGRWAPLKLLVQGMPKGWDGHSDLILRFRIPVTSDKGELGKLRVQYNARSEELGALLKVSEGGLSRPPEHVGGQ